MPTDLRNINETAKYGHSLTAKYKKETNPPKTRYISRCRQIWEIQIEWFPNKQS
jgi:hypothetical protein